MLADVFDKFRNNSLKKRISHYLSAPALSWDAMLNMTSLKVISDFDMYLFFEKDMRSRVSYISKRYIKGSNKYLESFDP